MTAKSHIGKLAQQARAIARRNAVLVANSGAVAIGNGATAILGLAYWLVAARLMPPEAVGISSALISAMGLIGQLGEGGIGTLLMGQLSMHGARRHGLVMAAGLIAGMSCFILALTSLAVAGLGMPRGYLFASGPWVPLLLLAGCTATGLAFVIDHSFIGLLQSRFLMYRSVVFSAAKLLLLVALPAWHAGGDFAIIIFSWIVGIVGSAVLIVDLAIRRGVLRICAPDFKLLFSLLPAFLSHHLLNVLAYAPPLAMPILVSVVVSSTASAAFYAVWMVLIIAFMVPGALTNVLYTLGTSDPHALAGRVRFSALASLAFSAVISLVFYLYSYQLLWIFNASYAEIAASSLQLLGVSLITGSIRLHYIAVVRIRNEMRRASVVLAASGIGGLVAATCGGWAFGLRGLAIGWILAGLAEIHRHAQYGYRGWLGRPSQNDLGDVLSRRRRLDLYAAFDASNVTPRGCKMNRKSVPIFSMSVAFGAALALAAAVLATAGTGPKGIVGALQLTARWSFLLFWTAYAGGSMAALFGPTLAPLARRGREFGLAFAAAHLIHIGLVVWLYRISERPPLSEGLFIFFTIGIVWTYVLAALSFGGLGQALGASAWRAVRFLGMNYILIAFSYQLCTSDNSFEHSEITGAGVWWNMCLSP